MVFDMFWHQFDADNHACSRPNLIGKKREVMHRKLVINEALHETRVALLEDGNIVELFRYLAVFRCYRAVYRALKRIPNTLKLPAFPAIKTFKIAVDFEV